MKYNYVTDYKDNETLRKSYSALANNTFGISFEEWYQNGFWPACHIPCSLADGDRIVSNVSVNRMEFDRDGCRKHYIQLGTVMTDKEYRGQGLSRYLIERVISEWKDQSDGIYLFANDRVLDFYPRFGFGRSSEYCYSKAVCTENKKRL